MKGDAVHQSDNVHNSPLLSTTFLYRILFVKAMEVKMFHAFWRVEARLRNKTDFWKLVFGNQKDIPQFLPHCTLWLGVIHFLWQNYETVITYHGLDPPIWPHKTHQQTKSSAFKYSVFCMMKNKLMPWKLRIIRLLKLRDQNWPVLKGDSSYKRFCNYLRTLLSFQTCKLSFFSWKTYTHKKYFKTATT